MVTHASVPQGYTHVTANTGLARAALPRGKWGRSVARGAVVDWWWRLARGGVRLVPRQGSASRMAAYNWAVDNQFTRVCEL